MPTISCFRYRGENMEFRIHFLIEKEENVEAALLFWLVAIGAVAPPEA